MLVINNLSSLKKWLSERTDDWALVPTMGNLHSGHLQLIEIAKKHAKKVIVSIYVNPTQFGINEDFDSYPRTVDEDIISLKSVDADAVLLPTESMIYPFGIQETMSYILPDSYTKILCGSSRIGHFPGVINVISRLFNLTRPQMAVFGAKDYQQQWIIKRFVQEFAYPIEIITVPISRANDGLALSSRNRYLTKEERKIAPNLYQSLQKVKNELLNGKNILVDEINALNNLGFTVEYFELRHKDTLQLTNNPQNAVLFIAAKLGKTRLIDNLEIN